MNSKNTTGGFVANLEESQFNVSTHAKREKSRGGGANLNTFWMGTLLFLVLSRGELNF